MLSELLIILSALVLIIFTSLYTILMKRKQVTGPLPPGPRGWPIIGSLHRLGPQPHEGAAQLAKEYGPVVRLRMGSRPTLFINDIEWAKAALARGWSFQGRPDFHSFQYMARGESHSTNSPTCPRWFTQQRIAQTVLREVTHGEISTEQITQVLEELTANLISSLIEAGDVDPSGPLAKLVITLNASLILGSPVDCAEDKVEGEDISEFMDLFSSLDEVLANGNPIDIWPWTRVIIEMINPKWLDKFRRLTSKIEELCSRFAKRFIDGEINYNEANTVIGKLITICERMTLKEKQKLDITDYQIMSTAQELLGASYDNLRHMLSFAIYFLTAHQHVQDKLRHEIDTALSSGITIGEASLSSRLPYLEAFIFESLRVGCLTPLGLPHSTIAPTNLGEYRIEEGTMVFINHWAINKDSNHFQDPERFNPHRFLDDSGKRMLQRESLSSFMPFGMGKRRCVGEELAKMVIRYIVISLVNQCKILTAGDTDAMMDLKLITTHLNRPGPFKIRAMRRKVSVGKIIEPLDKFINLNIPE